MFGPIRVMTDSDWQGTEHLPNGGCVVAANHISYADPSALGRFLHDNGHPPFFLAKDALFELPFLGRWLTAAGQVPVRRGTGEAISAYADAVEALVEAVTTATEAQLLRPLRRPLLQQIAGAALHDTYHGGQIGLLRKLYGGKR